MASKKKGRKRKRRVVDSDRTLAEAQGSGIEPGTALDDEESAKVPVRDKSSKKTERKPDKTGPKQEAKKGGVVAAVTKFLKDVTAEAKKVVWPDWEQLKNSTWVVLFTIGILALFMGLFSTIFFKFSNRVFIPDVDIPPPAATQEADVETSPDDGGGGGDAGGGVPADAEGTS